MKHIVTFIMAVIIVTGQEHLSRLKNWLYGGILPLCAVLFTIWCFCFRSPPLYAEESIYPFIILICFLLIEWGKGRDKLKKERKKELEKMEAHDIDTKI